MKKLVILIAVAACFFAFHAKADSIAFDASSTNGGYILSVTSTSFSCVVHAGSNRMLVVIAHDSNSVSSNHFLPSGVTYGGVSLTNQTSTNNFQSNNGYISMWYLLNPSVGTATATISVATTSQMFGTCISFSGVNQTTPIDVSATSSATTGGSFTQNVTTTVNNDWVISAFTSNQAPPAAAGANLKARGIGAIIAAIDGDSNGAITPAGAASSTATAASGFWQGAIMAIEPAPVAAATKRRQPIILLEYDPLATIS